MKYQPISSTHRRGFLRGAGVSLALPWLASLAQRNVCAAETKAPVRAAFLYFPNGVWEKDWNPTSEGEDYTLPYSLEPLGELKKDVLVLSGLDKKNSHGGDGHYAKTANFLTGMPVAKTTGKDISSGGASVDQIAAQKIGHLTPLPSLELGTEPVITGIDSNVGYTRLYGSYISWQTANRPVAKEINPRLVYERLFSKTLAADAATAASYQNLLDYVLDDAKRLRGKLGRDDQFKIDEYLDSVRAVEKRIEFHTTNRRTDGAPSDAASPGIPREFRDHIEIMLDLMVLAFRTDSTRLCTFMFANDVSSRNFSFIDGVRGAHHEMSHHENNPQKIEQYKRINRWHVEQFARLIGKMKAVREGESNLLDNSMILIGSSISDGNRHDPDNLPILLAGKAGGALKSGRHVAFKGQCSLCDVYLTMLQKLGVETAAFGDSAGPVAELNV